MEPIENPTHLASRGAPWRAVTETHTDLTQTIFHYTDRAGFAGLVDSCSLWATDINYLNDATEITHGRDLIYDTLHARSRESGAPRTRLANVLGYTPQFYRYDVYVACFCEDGDSLSQWRAYGARGGYAVGLRPDTIDRIRYRSPNVLLNRIVYDADHQRARARALVEELEQVVNSVADQEWTVGTCSNVALRFSIGALLLAARFKHPRFAEEREWRLTLVGGPIADVRYRPGRSVLTPYIPIPLDPPEQVMGELQIVAGPTPHPELAIEAAERLVRSKSGLRVTEEDRFRNSEIPYRDW